MFLPSKFLPIEEKEKFSEWMSREGICNTPEMNFMEDAFITNLDPSVLSEATIVDENKILSPPESSNQIS